MWRTAVTTPEEPGGDGPLTAQSGPARPRHLTPRAAVCAVLVPHPRRAGLARSSRLPNDETFTRRLHDRLAHLAQRVDVEESGDLREEAV